MLRKALSVCSIAGAAMALNEKSDDVLASDELESVKVFLASARDAFLERQGLGDFQAFLERKRIVDASVELALQEWAEPEDMKMFVRCILRAAVAGKDYYELLMLLKDSDNFAVARRRLGMHGAGYYLRRIAMTYAEVSVYIYDNFYHEAGVHFVAEVFPKKYKSSGTVAWSGMPYYNAYEGDFASGMLSGLIYQVTGQVSYDNLAACVKPAHVIDETFGGAADEILKKHNPNLMAGVDMFYHGF